MTTIDDILSNDDMSHQLCGRLDIPQTASQYLQPDPRQRQTYRL